MYRLIILPLQREISVDPGSNLLASIRKAGIEISSPCNGRGKCGKCKVKITDPPQENLENHQKHIRQSELAEGVRLACQVTVQQDMQVTLLDDYSQDIRILEGKITRNRHLKPAATIKQNGDETTLCYLYRPPVQINNWQSGFTPKGIAIDLGTTTLVVTLLDLYTGDVLASASALNPQTRFGQDIITRIQMASSLEGLTELAEVVSASLNRLVAKTCRDSNSFPKEIVDAVIGGNTTMLEIAAMIDPAPLGRLPFTISIASATTYDGKRFGLNLNPNARIYVPPIIHAFIGSDISAGVLSADLFNQDVPTLFIDIGTNGEMVLVANGHGLATSTAAGPALEGMGISHGMRAASGAIEMVWSSKDQINVKTIDDAPARGICGSGIIDIMACMIQLDAVDESGRMRNLLEDQGKQSPLAKYFEIIDKVPAIRLVDNVYFTQKDVREFQLVKSAIRTGIEMLLEAADLALDQLAKIVIAGAFGYHLTTESLRKTGIIPSDYNNEIIFLGNTSCSGCVQMLTDVSTRNVIEGKMQQVAHLTLAEKPDFQTHFVKNMAFTD